MSEYRPGEFGEILTYYLDEADFEELNLYTHSNLKLSDPPEDFLREIEYIDSFQIGRYLGHLQTQLSIIRKIHTRNSDAEILEGFEELQVDTILWEMYLVEALLLIVQICPDIRTQIKQQRQALASRYLLQYLEEEDMDIEEYKSLEETPDIGEQMVSHRDADRLYDSVTDWMYILIEEFEDLVGLTATLDSRLDIVGLLRNPEDFFRQEVWEWMDEQPREDFAEACRCIAFDAPTASVMLSLRAVEHSLRVWYEYDTGRRIEDRTFGQVLSEIQDVYEKDERPSVLSNLDYLKDRRNSVSHPEESASRREAERMLYRIEGTISEIYDHME